MRGIRKGVAVGLVSAAILGGSPLLASAQVLGDDYPAKWKNAPADSLVDNWTMYNRECTSFVAFRLSSANGYNLPVGYGNANTWGTIARNRGITVDNNPAVGSVAWSTAGTYGHVAWVANVIGDQVEIEEYNYETGANSHRYHRRTVHKSRFTGYIHFKDLGGKSTLTTSTASAALKLPARGSYRFTKSTPVKSASKMSSQTVATYDAGETVNYDSVLTADGYQWLSYIGASGARRYVPIQKV